MVDFNKWENVSRIYKGFFQIYIGNTPYKFLQPVSMEESVKATYAAHYSTDGKKKLASTGYDSTYTITVDNTAELYDTAATPADKKTISYFIDRIFDNEIPIVDFEGVEESDAATNKFIRNRFKGGIVDVSRNRNESTGTYEATLVIDITEKTKVQRTSS